MYLYELQIGDAVESLDHRDWGYVTQIDRVIETDGHGEDTIYFKNAHGEISSYRRWMLRRINVAAGAPPF